MKKIFLCFKKAGMTISKYLVFSVIFAFSLFMSTSVSAIDNGFSDYDYDGTEFQSGISNVNGTLSGVCSYGNQYTIKNGSYSGKNELGASTSTNCVSYTATDGTQYYYLQAIPSVQATPSTWNKVTFEVNDTKKYTYIIVAEYGFSKSDNTKTDYDLFSIKSASEYEYDYSQIRCSSTDPLCEAWDRSGHKGVASRDASKYTFEYYLRDSSYGAHQIEVYFYSADSEPDLGDLKTANVEVKYILTRPISDFTFNVDHYLNTSPARDCNINAYEICLDYGYAANTGDSNNGLKTNTFNIYFSKHAAFYFSTLNTHKKAGDADRTVANIKKYNSIYATNTFYNEGDDAKTTPIVYNYYNFTDDLDDYNDGDTNAVYPTKVNYAFKLTIDSSGCYRFYLTDIFGNHVSQKTMADSEVPNITDISNRIVTIYYIAYSSYKNDTIANVVTSDIISVGEEIRDFQLPFDTLANITNTNVTIGLEFYSTVQIKPDYAVQESINGILSTPLYYEDDGTNVVTNIRMEKVGTGVETTYFCRLQEDKTSPTEGDCVTPEQVANGNSNFGKRKLLNDYTIAANSEIGKKAVYNNFINNAGQYYESRLDDSTRPTLQTNTRKNRTQFVVNENGVYFVRVQDIYGNYKETTIKVSIIDQLKPVITFDGITEASAKNNICSSMYVVGAGGTIATYPQGKLESCTANSVLYDHFTVVGDTYSTEKENTIRNELIITKPSVKVEETNGFYNMETNLVSFNYADAIRMGLVRITDSVMHFNKTLTEKSIYEATSNSKHLNYQLISKDRNGDPVTDGLDRIGTIRQSYGYQSPDYTTDLIISNNYTQYSSELKPTLLANKEFVVFTVKVFDGTAYKTVCATGNSADTNQQCYDMVNAYIDKGINFSLTFKAIDYAENESLEKTIEITVLDDTTPGIATLKDESGKLVMDATYPKIPKNNLDTTCRLEIGSMIQHKFEILKCFGIVVSETSYNVVDNATGYFEINSDSYDANHYVSKAFTGYTNTPAYNHTDRIYKYALHSQLYNSVRLDEVAPDDSIYSHIKVYVCTEVGVDGCDATEDWSEITDSSNIKFDDAGSYKLKVEIKDLNHGYVETSTSNQNTTTLIFCYYVNPRVLLVKPIEKTMVYGTYDKNDLKIDYCVYATTNNEAFFYNLFKIQYNNSNTYRDMYHFVNANYETNGVGLVYCTNYNGATVDDKTELTASSLDLVLSGNGKVKVDGELGITYATGTNQYNMSMISADSYYDAGYYYITMGDLKIAASTAGDTKDYSKNYVLRLHPEYLLEDSSIGITGPDGTLTNYDSAAIKNQTKYNYGVVGQESKGETVSNVLYTVEQAKLTVKAVGGSKDYGMPDTNYPQASNTQATTNVKTYKNTFITDPDSQIIEKSKKGYLGGFDIEGLVHNNHVDDETRMNSVIKGYLRRQLGEEAGVYRICSSTDPISHVGCDVTDFSQNDLNEVRVTDTSKVFVTLGATSAISGDTVRYGMYLEVGGVRYKLTKDNSTISPTEIILKIHPTSNVWEYREANEKDEKYTVYILANSNNGNKNYYIEYQDATYSINPGKIIVQPGSNQGKEYANPQKADPMFEIIVYGETRGIVASNYDADDATSPAFTGFTKDVTDKNYPNQTPYTQAPYMPVPADPSDVKNDTELYFEQKRTRTTDLFESTKFIYQFTDITLAADNTFTWLSTKYKYKSATEVCLAENDTQCSSKIGHNNGIYSFKLKSGTTNVLQITTEGKLTYQNYSLLTGATTGSAASITRTSADNADGYKVNWYGYVFHPDNMHVITNEYDDTILRCKVDKTTVSYLYTIDETGTGNCGNYGLVWDDNAPAITLDNTDIKEALTIENTGAPYKHNGVNTCDNESVYTVSCGADVTKIKFLIFKRDVIISFNGYQETYGQTYEHYKNNVFKVEDVATVPEFKSGLTKTGDLIQCYEKTTVTTEFNVPTKGYYSEISSSLCNSSVYGIGSSDTWGDGDDGLNLRFFLSETIQKNFTQTTYPVPAGLYYVDATIGELNATTGKYVHPNYNLVYINYYIIYKKLSNTNPDNKGAINITSRSVNLVGTYYQKEYGQGAYASYGSNDTDLDVISGIGSSTYSAQFTLKKDATTNWIFDNHYYHCNTSSSTAYVSAIEAAGSTHVARTTNNYYGCDTEDVVKQTMDANFGFGEIGNVFGYTVAPSGDTATTGMVKLTNGNADKISSNFYGTPYRPDLIDEGANGDALIDPYGLLANVGFYQISLANITPAVAQYLNTDTSDPNDLVDFTKDAIERRPNYSINDVKHGALYITPASITISPTSGQTKMYGCAYNAFNVSAGTYTYEKGYEDCVENDKTNYDLGYQYTVSNDKYNYLMHWVSDSATAGIKQLSYAKLGASESELAICEVNRKPNSDLSNRCADISYTSNGYYNYLINPDYTHDNTFTTKPSNTALNEGTLFRAPTAGDTKYDYKTHFDYATGARKAPNATGKVYQNQTEGDYMLTLGDLDSRFNVSDSKMCNSTSTPIKDTNAGYICKNFIINYDGINTARHGYNGSSDTFTGTEEELKLVLDDANLKFTITHRQVVIHTEYNFKIYGDTDPVEGFTCANLSLMFNLSNDFTGRESYCQATTTFIPTGAARYYAVDNSLAKAPWTGWTTAASAAKANYNDILFDVINPATSYLYRDTSNTDKEDPERYDSGGEYEYIYDIFLNESLNGKNYTIAYIEYVDGNDGKASTLKAYAVSSTDTNADNYNHVVGANVGFAISSGSGADIELERWYGNDAHTCHSEVGQESTLSCPEYTGEEEYNFYINGIEKSTSERYTIYTAGGNSSIIKPRVYFEIIHREIYIETIDWSKDYGIEENYNNFDVRLVTPVIENGVITGYTDIRLTSSWGDPRSLSKEDYERFFPEGVFSQENFKGSNDPASYRGGSSSSGDTARAFGIEFYRTYGEKVGEYVIVACPTQSDPTATGYKNPCVKYYEDLYDSATDKDVIATGKNYSNGDDKILTSEVTDAMFIAASSRNEYNASNYIVYTIPGKLTINKRQIKITPDEGQGFQYGNFNAGVKIDPITYTETYKSTSTSGLVNGKMWNSSDNVLDQYALCLYNIAGVVTCINDRQNSSTGTIEGYIETDLRGGNPSTVLTERPAHEHRHADDTSIGEKTIRNNVYNDDYTSDNDTTRFALDRVMESSSNVSRRYNRNRGVYKITFGELNPSSEVVCDVSNPSQVNCLNANYDIVGFDDTQTYEITAADIEITPKATQSKTYGDADIHLTFSVVTRFTYKQRNIDTYYCGSHCQDENSYDGIGVISGGVVTINGFAYGEDSLDASDAIETNYNYGIAKNSNKSEEFAHTSEGYSGYSKAASPKYFDKYCKGMIGSTNPTCDDYDSSAEATRYASLKYGETSRILLGYFYVKYYEQKAHDTLSIRNGILIAQNEFGNVNYNYVYYDTSSSTWKPNTLDRDTGVTFKINKLAVDATINSITKVYGQATDAYKADETITDGIGNHAVSMSSNAADNNENRLEYNFDVTGSGVNTVNNIVLLTKAIDGKYYTQTGNKETKNIHLGLSVVRSINATTTCLVNSDLYGCEDANASGESYTLVFRKVVVLGGVDNNYNVTFAGVDPGDTTTDTGTYAHVETTDYDPTGDDEDEGIKDGQPFEYKTYIVYPSGVSRDEPATGEIKIYDSYKTATLTITKRKVQFYVGTWEENGIAAERFVIEQNEEVPQFPELKDGVGIFTTSLTNPQKKTVYLNTWFDIKEYASGEEINSDNVPRQVRTADQVITSLAKGVNDPVMGVGICSKPAMDVQSVVYGDSYCKPASTAESGEGKFIHFHEANTIVNGEYVFDTSMVGNYAILRNYDETYISIAGNTHGYDYENKNYDVDDWNGALVIYEDQTAPSIIVGNKDGKFAIEANADSASCTSVTNNIGESFVYNCNVQGKLFDENNKSVGQILEYIANNYSAYNGAINKSVITEATKNSFKLGNSISGTTWSGWIYYPVNNTGNAGSVTTLFNVDRTENTYVFDTNFIKVGMKNNQNNDTSPDLAAITSIISYFNVNSYDYGYIRNGKYITKRYTPRYYFYVDKADGTAFDPTVVGTFRVTVYAIDNVGNQSSVELTLELTDKTKPEIGEMHLFNAKVVCSTNPCKTNNISSWTVKPNEYVPISAFAKYKKVGEDYKYDPVNGTWIVTDKTASGLVMSNITWGVQRYNADQTENIQGDYIKVTSSNIPATEVEHKYWYNSKSLYLVIVGGKDNSYIDSVDDSDSQWHTYYSVDAGTSWYKYPRHSNAGVEIKFEDGISQIHTRIIDSGRSITVPNPENTYTYYNNMYLMSNSGVCSGTEDAANCEMLTEGANNKTKEVVQVKNKAMIETATVGVYTFDINATILTYDSTSTPKKVTWVGGDADGEEVDSNGEFTYGIMKCVIGPITPVNPGDPPGPDVVNCAATYNLLYKKSDKKTIAEIEYRVEEVGSDRNLNDWDVLTFDASNKTSRFYNDRRYVYIDTTIPEINALNEDPFSLYEYDTECKAGYTTDLRCKQSYKEQFLTAKDAIVEGNTPAADVIDDASLTDLAIGAVSGDGANMVIFEIDVDGNALYHNESAVNVTSDLNYASLNNKSSGIVINNARMYSGASEYDDADGSADFNKNKIELVVYLVARKGGVTSYYRYIALYIVDKDGASKFVVDREKKDDSDDSYSVVKNYDEIINIAPADVDTIEEVLEFIVSTASIENAVSGGYLDFTISYKFYDAAGNKSVFKANKTVRGITYVKYESTVTFQAPVVATAMVNEGGNTYSMQVNQGVNLMDVLSGFKISNVNYKGDNNLSGLRRLLYYNGELIDEFNDDESMIATISSYASKYPGKYTLKVTSSRLEIVSGKETTIYDEPLTINFDVSPLVTTINNANNYQISIIALISMVSASFVMIGFKIISKKRKEEN